MEHRMNSLDLHFRLPSVRKVSLIAPLAWVERGWWDLRANPLPSLAYGLVFALMGHLILTYTAGQPHLGTVSVAAFFLLGPLAAAGLYEISRLRGLGRRATLAESLAGIRRHAGSLATFGLALALVVIGWERVSAVLFALLYTGRVPDLDAFLREVFLSGHYPHFVVSYLTAALIVATLVFALMAFAIPHTLHKGTDTITASMASLRAVSNNLRAMALWAAIIVVLMAVGLLTQMLAMVIVVPLLGHATWHLYRKAVPVP